MSFGSQIVVKMCEKYEVGFYDFAICAMRVEFLLSSGGALVTDSRAARLVS